MVNTVIGPIGNQVGASNSGVTNTLTVDNASNTASSQAKVLVTVGGGTAGDAFTEYQVSGVTTYAVGIDNSDSDKLKITTGADPSSGTTAVTITSAGVLSLTTPLDLASGGTNANLTADNGGIVYSDATKLQILAHTATANQPLLSGASGAPGWSTATYPGSTTINQLLYSSAANTITGLATANNGTLVTSAAGVPSILAGPGTTGQVLQSNAAAAPSFSTASFPSTATGTGTILRADGTNWVATTATYPATTTISQILYSSANNVIGGITTANSGVLTTDASGVPSITNTISLITSGTTLATLSSTDAGAGAGPIVDLYRNSGSPAASDSIGQIIFNGQNSTPAKVSYCTETTQIDTATASAEDSSWRLATRQAGTLTNQIVALNTGCQIRGNNAITAPPAGYLGEQIQSTVASGSAVTLTTATAKDVTSITLTPGIWDITGVIQFTGGAITGTQIICSISTTSNTLNAATGDATTSSPTVPTAGSDVNCTVPVLRQRISSNTTYYLVARSTFTVGTVTAYGRISAVRTG